MHYGYYRSFQTNDGERIEQKSGAYIFRAVSQQTKLYGSNSKTICIKKGSQVIDILIKREPLVNTRLRFYNTSNLGISDANTNENTLLSQTIEIETTLEEIPVDDNFGKEIVLIIADTGIQNDGVFYTNSNGLETRKRIRNSVISVEKSAAGNFYPVNSAIYIEDKRASARVTLMNDRSQGGSSLRDGSIEIMINRRILEDDSRGLAEPLNDERPVQVKHWLFFSKGSIKQRSLQYDLDTQPLIYFSTITQLPHGQENLLPKIPDHTATTTVDLVKFYIRIYSENEILVRLHNLREDQSVLVKEFYNKKEGTWHL